MVKNIFRDKRMWYVMITVFILLITVFDRNNILEGWRVKKMIKELEAQRDYYQERITEDSTVLENLKNDSYLEQFAREHYLMKRDGETVFLMRDE